MSAIITWITDVVLAVCFGVKELAVVLVSMVPIVELKGGIPIGLKFGMGYWEAFWWAFLGSSIICIPLLLILGPVFRWAKGKKSIGDFFTRVENVFKRKAGMNSDIAGEPRQTDVEPGDKSSNPKIPLSKIIGVFLFSMLPIPGAGVWTASFVAVLLGLSFGWAVISIIFGNLVDGLITVGLTKLIGQQNLDTALFILFVAVIIFVIVFLYKVFTGQTGKGEIQNT